MNDTVLNPIHGDPVTNGVAPNPEPEPGPGPKDSSAKISKRDINNSSNSNVVVRRERPQRACTARPTKYVDPPIIERRPKKERVVKLVEEVVEDVEEEEDTKEVQCGGGRVVTVLVEPPPPELMPRWRLRSMWELASILNFLHVFRALLNIRVEFSAEELESALLNPNSTLGDIHIPLLKAIPPITRMAYGRDTWVTVLCRKLRDWWHWVAEGELPIVADHGAEIETYKTLDPAVRVVILKALCDIRVEQDDVRSYIESSLKHGAHLSAFRKERIGGDSRGISYWYEDDEFIGHRLYRETRKVESKIEGKKGKTKGSNVLPSTTYEWETVATSFDEFLDVSEKLFSSKNRTEVSLGKKLKNAMLPEIEKIHKRKEKLMKKQQRQALLLDNYVNMDGLAGGRSLRDRKPVTYTFDDFDRSINEAIKITKRKQPSPEPGVRRELRSDTSANGRYRWNGSSHNSQHVSFSPPSPVDYDEMDVDANTEQLDRSNRRRQRPQRYSAKEFVEGISDHEEYFESDDEIVGEAVYDDEYLQQCKQKKRLTSSSEGEPDDEYQWSEENGGDEVGEEEEDSLNTEDSDQPRVRRFDKPEGRTRRGTKLRSVDDLDAGLRRSKRASKNRIDYRQIELSDSENETSMKHRKVNASSERHYDATVNAEYSMESQDTDDDEDDDAKGNLDEQQEREFGGTTPMDVENNDNGPRVKSESPKQDDSDGIGSGSRRFLDLNELAPGSGFDDGLSAFVKDDDQKGE